jgi:hypothetical protein
MRDALLYAYCLLTNYRFRSYVTGGLRSYYPDLTIDEVRAKAGASLTSVSALLAFVVAVLPFAASTQLSRVEGMFEFEKARHQLYLCVTLALILPYSSFWLERHISAAKVETSDPAEREKLRCSRTFFLVLSIFASLFLFFIAPCVLPSWLQFFQLGFALAGAAMTVLSVVFLLFALEFYDSAAGWRGDATWHFHFASIASNSYVFGLSLALVGACLTICTSHFLIGRVLATVALFAVVAITEIERALWDLGKL